MHGVCLLVVAWQTIGDWPLVVGANRDEWLDRPATSITVLCDVDPRILGGRDERAGGTWLAVSEHGVVCGLTNRPMPDGPDPTKRSRGRLPLVAARCRTAEEAAETLVAEVGANAYNAAWLLVGDRRSLHYVAVEPDGTADSRRLEPGLHVLENAPLDERSVKVDHVRAMLADAEAHGTARWDALHSLLRLHTDAIPPGEIPMFADGRERLAATLAPCVHADGYGTRSSSLVRVSANEQALPQLAVAEGPPCTHRFVDTGELWSSDA